jgi:hypothetical protein
LLVAGHSAVGSWTIAIALKRSFAIGTRLGRPTIFKSAGRHVRILPGFPADMEGVKYA